MKITEKEICEYLFDLLEPARKIEIQSALDSDPVARKEYIRLKNKFDRLNLLDQDYPNPILYLSQWIAKHSAIAAVLALVFSLWFLPNQAYAENPSVVIEDAHQIRHTNKVCCTSGISPEKSPKFDENLDEILAQNIHQGSSIDQELNYSTKYLKKLSL